MRVKYGVTTDLKDATAPLAALLRLLRVLPILALSSFIFEVSLLPGIAFFIS